MKAEVKKLECFPATVMEGVYVSGTGVTIQNLLDNDFIKTFIRKNSNKLKRFRGMFRYTADNYQYCKDSAKSGDYWFYDGDIRINMDASVLNPGGILYFDGVYYKTIDLPAVNDIAIQPKYDVCIVGGGAGGIGAAYALKDSGWRVCLVEKLDTLGGTHCNAGVGLMIASPICKWYKDLAADMYNDGILGFYNNGTANQVPVGVGYGTDFERQFRASQFTDPQSVINGFIGNHTQISDTRTSKRYFKDLCGSIDIITNQAVLETVSANGKVDYIKVKNTLDGKENIICADYFIDCSGDGVLFTSDQKLTLDTDYYVGTDPKDRFNEGVYPNGYQGDHYGINTVEPVYYQTGTFYGQSGFKLPPLPTKYKKYDGVTARSNFGFGSLGDIGYVSSISNSYGTRMSLERFITYDDTWNLADGYDRALATFMVGGYTAANRFAGTRKLLAIREKYRIACEKTVDQAYLEKQITSSNYADEHTIALSTWYVDIHNQGYHCVSNIANGVPYEAMIPKCYKNALVACRAFGASHIGLSSVRLVKTMMDMGHSAGTAILQLLNKDTRVDVRNVDVVAVQSAIGIADVVAELEEYFYNTSLR